MNSEFATVRVRYQETDQMGVVYHANYFVWFEVARTKLFRKVGLKYADLERDGIYVPVVEAYCKYISSARYDDEIDIYPQVAEIGCSKFKISYTVKRRPTDQLLAKGETTHCFVGKDKKPLFIKRDCPGLSAKLARAAEMTK